MTSNHDTAPRTGAVASPTLGRALGRAVADTVAARGREIPDRRTPEHRNRGEHRRARRQAARALDRELAPVLSPEGARVCRGLVDAEREQEFYRLAGLWLADLTRALDYLEPDEYQARAEAMAAALGRVQNRSVA